MGGDRLAVRKGACSLFTAGDTGSPSVTADLRQSASRGHQFSLCDSKHKVRREEIRRLGKRAKLKNLNLLAAEKEGRIASEHAEKLQGGRHGKGWL